MNCQTVKLEFNRVRSLIITFSILIIAMSFLPAQLALRIELARERMHTVSARFTYTRLRLNKDEILQKKPFCRALSGGRLAWDVG